MKASVPVSGTPSLSLCNGCMCVPEAGVTAKDLLLVVGEQVGCGNIVSAEIGLWVKEIFDLIMPFAAPATKVTISIVPLFVSDEPS